MLKPFKARPKMRNKSCHHAPLLIACFFNRSFSSIFMIIKTAARARVVVRMLPPLSLSLVFFYFLPSTLFMPSNLVYLYCFQFCIFGRNFDNALHSCKRRSSWRSSHKCQTLKVSSWEFGKLYSKVKNKRECKKNCLIK